MNMLPVPYLSLRLEESFHRAVHQVSNLPKEIIAAEGSSGKMARHLHNNLSSMFNGELKYLEIGTQRGLSFCTSLYNNPYKYACVIDNWCEGDYRLKFKENVENFLKDKEFDVYDQDCWTIDLDKQIKEKINFYFYDGWHSMEAQEKAFTYFNPVLEDVFLCMVDDWNDPDVRKGTFNAFNKLNYQVLASKSLFTENYNNVISPGAGNSETWWNGLYIAIISK